MSDDEKLIRVLGEAWDKCMVASGLVMKMVITSMEEITGHKNLTAIWLEKGRRHEELRDLARRLHDATDACREELDRMGVKTPLVPYRPQPEDPTNGR